MFLLAEIEVELFKISEKMETQLWLKDNSTRTWSKGNVDANDKNNISDNENNMSSVIEQHIIENGANGYFGSNSTSIFQKV